MPLQVTQRMFSALVDHYSMMPEFQSLPLPFVIEPAGPKMEIALYYKFSIPIQSMVRILDSLCKDKADLQSFAMLQNMLRSNCMIRMIHGGCVRAVYITAST